jgi:hypothetical protein
VVEETADAATAAMRRLESSLNRAEERGRLDVLGGRAAVEVLSLIDVLTLFGGEFMSLSRGRFGVPQGRRPGRTLGMVAQRASC